MKKIVKCVVCTFEIDENAPQSYRTPLNAKFRLTNNAAKQQDALKFRFSRKFTRREKTIKKKKISTIYFAHDCFKEIFKKKSQLLDRFLTKVKIRLQSGRFEKVSWSASSHSGLSYLLSFLEFILKKRKKEKAYLEVIKKMNQNWIDLKTN